MDGATAPLGPPWPAVLVELAGRCTFPPPGTPVDLAVSGGADSSALAVLAVVAGCAPRLHHVDHGLRPGSADEAEVVRALAGRLGVPFTAVTVHVGDGGNVEARARTARYAVLPEGVLTGHTLDDRAETVLSHLLRGTGLDGLAAMRATDARRPLFALRRSDTETVCATCGIEPVEDPSNRDPRFVRNRVRHELLPLMDDIAGRDVAPLLAATGDLASVEVEALDALSMSLDPRNARALAAAPRALAVRALRRWLRAAHDGYAPSRDELDRVLAVANGHRRATELAGGWRVTRSHGTLGLAPPPGAGPDRRVGTADVATSHQPTDDEELP